MSFKSKYLISTFAIVMNIGVYSQSSTINKQCVKQIIAGGNHCIVLMSDKSLWTWGVNNAGQLGDNSYKNNDVARKVGNDNDWTSVTAGQNFTHAIKADGTLWGWGNNKIGQLGISTANLKYSYNTPTQVGLDKDWCAVSSGNTFTIGLKTDGTIWVWGANIYYLINDKINQSEPIKIIDKNNQDWKKIATGNEFIMAIKKDGTLWTLGSINGENKAFAKINKDTDWSIIDAGRHHAMAIKEDGSLWSWGQNNNGQLGNGTTQSSKIPIKIGENYSAVSANDNYTTAIKKNGDDVWWWGKSTAIKKMQSTPERMRGTSYFEYIASGNNAIYILMDELNVLEFSHDNKIGNFSLKQIK